MFVYYRQRFSVLPSSRLADAYPGQANQRLGHLSGRRSTVGFSSAVGQLLKRMLGAAENPPRQRGSLLMRAQYSTVAASSILRRRSGRNGAEHSLQVNGWRFIAGYRLAFRLPDIIVGVGTSANKLPLPWLRDWLYSGT